MVVLCKSRSVNDTRRAVLEALSDGAHSGTDLAADLAVSRAAVWKHVEALRDAGFAIESTQAGYELVGVPEYGAEAVEFGLDAPFEVRYEERTGSTNDVARDLAADGESDVVVLAEEQTGGRGRLDREWASPSGGVWASILFRPDRPPATVPLFTLAAAVAVTDTAREAGVDAGIKWPNDVLVRTTPDASDRQRSTRDHLSTEDHRSAEDSEDVRQGPKLAGILTEMEGEADRVSWVVVGLGVNVNVDADALPPGATSVREQVGDVERRAFVQRLVERFHELRSSPGEILPAWRDHSLTLGRRVRLETVDDVLVGTAKSVEHPGALVLETEDGTRRVHAGDCEHLRSA